MASASKSKMALLFPGQGAQYVGMGKDFFENFAIARETFEEADDHLKRKLSKVIFEGPDTLLTETQNSQLAIFVVSIALLRTIKQLIPQIQPYFYAGLSLGEYTALYAAKRIQFSDALSLIQFRSQCMQRACEQTQGTMAAILGLNAEAIDKIVSDLRLPNDLWVANYNCPGQIVLSGTEQGIKAASAAVLAHGAKKVIPLRVQGAFHSGLMRSAEGPLAEYMAEISFKENDTELVMNVVGHGVKKSAEIRTNLIKQVTGSVRWEHGIRHMETSGVTHYIEVGCGKTLSGFNKRIEVAAPTLSIETLKDLNSLETLR